MVCGVFFLFGLGWVFFVWLVAFLGFFGGWRKSSVLDFVVVVVHCIILDLMAK